MGVRFDERGITIRNFFRIYRFGWGEVRRFRDGLFQQSGEGGTIYFWVLTIQLHDGRDVTAKGTARKNGPRSQTLAAIRQAAERHSIPAALTGIAMRGGSPANPGRYPDPGGQPELRRWDGEEWSPLLEPDPASSVPRTAQRALEVYSPLSGSEQNGTMPPLRPGGPRSGSLSALWRRLEPQPGHWL
jgi:hypothetical protein